MILTLVTLKSCTLTGLLLVSYNLLLFKCWFVFHLQEVLPALRVPPKGGWASLLLGCQGFLAPGVQSEGEGRPNVEGELESLPLAAQRLTEGQALGCQRGVSFINCGHFGLLLN